MIVRDRCSTSPVSLPRSQHQWAAGVEGTSMPARDSVGIIALEEGLNGQRVEVVGLGVARGGGGATGFRRADAGAAHQQREKRRRDAAMSGQSPDS